MSGKHTGRRGFLKTSLTTVASVAWTTARAHSEPQAAPPEPSRTPRLRFAAIGLNHGHINGQVDAVRRGGGEIVSFYAKEPDLAAAFAQRWTFYIDKEGKVAAIDKAVKPPTSAEDLIAKLAELKVAKAH